MGENESNKNNESGQSKFMVALAVGCLAILGLYKIGTYGHDFSYKSFSSANYYKGQVNSTAADNPKDVYNLLVGNKLDSKSASECVTTPTIISLVDLEDKGCYWSGNAIAFPALVSSSHSDNVTYWKQNDEGKTYGNDVNDIAKYPTWHLWERDVTDKRIVSPWTKFTFENDNTTNTIRISKGGGDSNDKYVLEFKNVKNWYCHLDSSEEATHTTRVGYGTDYSTFETTGDGFYVIGMANQDTEVTGYLISGTTEVKVDPSEILNATD